MMQRVVRISINILSHDRLRSTTIYHFFFLDLSTKSSDSLRSTSNHQSISIGAMTHSCTESLSSSRWTGMETSQSQLNLFWCCMPLHKIKKMKLGEKRVQRKLYIFFKFPTFRIRNFTKGFMCLKVFLK